MKKIFNTLFVILTLCVNFIAVSLPLNGKTPRQLSDQYPNYFTPAPITFSIWSVIYLVIAALIVWQFIPFKNQDRAARRDAAISALGWQFVYLNLLNMGWLVLWHYEQVVPSVAVMLTMLMLLIRINILFFKTHPISADTRLFLQLPFGLYLGWISVATVANITAMLVYLKWSGWGISPVAWTIIVIVIAIVLAVMALLRWRNVPYALAVAWALYGIVINHKSEATLLQSDIILWTAGIGAAGLLVFSLFRGRKYQNG